MAAASAAAEERSDDALRAAGASEQVITGIKLAGVAVNFIMFRRRSGGPLEGPAKPKPSSPRQGFVDQPPGPSHNKPPTSTTRRPKLQFWKGWKEVNGRRVYQRDDLFDPKETHAGMTNLERMRAGKPPIGKDGKPVVLHHLTQQEPGSMAEVAGEFHSRNQKALHRQVESKRSFRYSPDRKLTEPEKAFRRWSRAYWKERARRNSSDANAAGH